MTANVFEIYDKNVYLDWHNREVEEGCDFEKFVTNFREELKGNSAKKLESLAQLLTQIKQLTEPECKLQSKGMLSGEFELPIKQFSEKSSPKRPTIS